VTILLSDLLCPDLPAAPAFALCDEAQCTDLVPLEQIFGNVLAGSSLTLLEGDGDVPGLKEAVRRR
jgi:hypothetical protein